MLLTNFSPTPKVVCFTNKVYDEEVAILGNFIIDAYKCAFRYGLRINSNVLGVAPAYIPESINLDRCHFENRINDPKAFRYPLKIAAINAPRGEYIKAAHIMECTAQGKGIPYLAGGTPDNIAIHNCNQIVVADTISIDGGENGFSLNRSNDIVVARCRAEDNDGQGIHIGDHKTQTVPLVLVEKFVSSNNMKDAGNSREGVGVGVLLHNVREATISRLISTHNKHAISFIIRTGKSVLKYSDLIFHEPTKPLLNSPAVTVVPY